jgi:hypothetical protein
MSLVVPWKLVHAGPGLRPPHPPRRPLPPPLLLLVRCNPAVLLGGAAMALCATSLALLILLLYISFVFLFSNFLYRNNVAKKSTLLDIP